MPTEARAEAADQSRALAERTIVDLARAMKNVSFYEAAHPAVQNVLLEVRGDLDRLLEGRAELVLKLVDGYLVVNDIPMMSQHASIGNLIGACHRRDVNGIVFQRGVALKDVEHLVELLAAEPGDVDAAGGMAAELSARGVRRISIERLRSTGGKDWRWAHSAALDVMRGAATDVRRSQPLDVGSIKWSLHEIVDNVLGERSIVYGLGSMKGMDEYTFIHALHLCILAVELGRQLGLNREQLEEIGVCALLHDVGKIFVPLEILRKPGPLDNEEFAIMSLHPVRGAAVLAPEPGLTEAAALVAFEHHMHMDYSGYPKLRRARPLHMYSLMASITDVYDALTTSRPYRPAMPPHRAVALIKEQYEKRMEPLLLRQFLAMLGPYPWGSLLRLDEKRFALVVRPNAAEPENPLARVIDTGMGEPALSEEQTPLRHLADSPTLESVDPADLGIDVARLLHHTK
jgi:HD-GYP domain-containing protein (c-di-GMP phosphodiesterase class II)